MQMLNTTEYKSMLESGVDAGFLAIVESAFRAMFEAGGKPALNNPLQPLSLEDMARYLNIGTDDCTGPDGRVNWNAVSRKLYDDRRFAAVDMKVNAIVRRALDMAALKYVDESGTPVYAYPALSRNQELSNIEENLKNGLKHSLVKRFSEVEDPQRFIELVNGISVEGGARAVAESFLDGIRWNVKDEREPDIHSSDIHRDSAANEYLPGEAPTPAGKLYADELGDVVMENEDGSRWITNGSEYVLINGLRQLVHILIDSHTRLVIRWDITLYATVIPDAAIVHDFVNLFVDLYHKGAAAGVDSSLEINDDRSTATEAQLSGTRAHEFITENIDAKDLVRLVRLDEPVILSMWNESTDSPRSIGWNDIEGLRVLIDFVDEGLLDADDLLEWAEHIDEPDWIASNVDPRMLMVAKQRDPRLFSGRKDSARRIEELFRHLMRYSDELIPALTGSEPSRPRERFSPEDLPVTQGAETVDELFGGRLTSRMLGNPKVQVEVLKRLHPSSFLNAMLRAIGKCGYIPISREAVDYILMTGDESAREGKASTLVDYYYLLVHDAYDKYKWDTRTMKRLFEEVCGNLDERVTSMIDVNSNEFNNLVALARNVPGFDMPEEYDTPRIDHDDEANKLYRGAMSPAHFVRLFGKAAYRDVPKEHQFRIFKELCMSEAIRKEYEARTPIGKKIRLILMSFAAEEPYLDEGMKGTPRDVTKLWELTSRHMRPFFNNEEMAGFFGTYLNGKDADLSRLYAAKSGAIDARMYPLFGGLLRTFEAVYGEDESLAISAFFGQKWGILSCTSTEMVEVPGATGKKGNRRPVQKDVPEVRLGIAMGLAALSDSGDLFGTDGIKKPFVYVINECIAGRHLLLEPAAALKDIVAALLELSQEYDDYAAEDEDFGSGTPRVDDSHRIVSVGDLDHLIMNDPGLLLATIRHMPRSLAHKLCTQYFTEENVRRMSRTREGLKLFLDIAERGEMGDTEWANFAAAFARGNANNIKNLVKTLPEEEGNRIMEKLGKYINASGDAGHSKFTAVSGSETDARLGSTVSFSMANGLRWMKGYVTGGNPAVMSEDGLAGLYSMEEAARMFGSVVDGWRLPTEDEILHLGDNPDTISEEALGFTGTGMADADGELISGSEDFCFAWCMGKDGPVGYSVDSNNVIEVGDSNIEPDFRLAVKLVR